MVDPESQAAAAAIEFGAEVVDIEKDGELLFALLAGDFMFFFGQRGV